MKCEYRQACSKFIAAILFTGIAIGAFPVLAQTNFYYENPGSADWDLTSSFWATPNPNSPLGLWGNVSTDVANIDNQGLSALVMTMSNDITAQSLVMYTTSLNTATSAGLVTYNLESNNSANYSTYNNLTLASGSIVQAFTPNNKTGTINTFIDANVVAGSVSTPADLTITATGTPGSAGASSFGDTTIELTGVNTFKDLHIGGSIANINAFNTVAIDNPAGLPSTSTVYFDGGSSAFVVNNSTTGNPADATTTLRAGNFVINNTGNYTKGAFVVGVGATADNTLVINGGIIGAANNNNPALDGIGQGDVQFSTGFSGALQTNTLANNGTGLVILNGQSNYVGQTRFNAGVSITTSGPIQAYVRLGINNALPMTTDLIMSYTTGNGGNFDLNGFNQTVGSISTTVLNSPSYIFNSGGASGTTPSTLTISGSDSPGAFNDAIDDADPNSSLNSLESPGTSAPLTLVRSGTGSTILTNISSAYSGGTQILGGTLSVNDDRQLGSTMNPAVPQNVIISGGTLAASSSFALSPSRTIAVGAPSNAAGTISVAGASTLTYNGAISDFTGSGGPIGTGGLILTGGGTLSLGGANQFTGPTQVNQGTLLLASGGSLAASSAVTVASGGTLSGVGMANGSVAISGMIAPGSTSSIGALNVGSLALNGGGSYTWKLSNASGSAGFGYDTVNVAGALTLNNTQASPFAINAIPITGGATFDNTQAFSWTLAAATSPIPAFNPNIFSVTSSLGGVPGSSFSVSASGDDLILNYNPGSTQFFQWMSVTAGARTGSWDTVGTNQVWTSGGTTGPWSNTGSGNGPWGAEFGGTAGTVTLGAPIVAAGLVFQSSGYAIAGSGANTLTTSSVSVGTGSTATISAPVVGTGFTLSGGGTLILNNSANSLSGTTTINAGTLRGNAASLASNISLASGTSLIFDQATDGNYASNLTGSGSVTKLNSGTLALSGNNSGFTGAFNIVGGTLSISADAPSGASAQLGASVPSIVNINGGTLQTTAGVTSTRSILVGNTGTATATLDLDGQNVVFEGGTATSPSVTLNNGGTFTISSSQPGGNLTILSSLSTTLGGPNTGIVSAFTSTGGQGMIVVNGPNASLTLGNKNDYTGNNGIINTAFGGSSTTDNSLTLNNASLTIAAGAQAGASPILQSLTINGSSSITLWRADSPSSQVALFSQTMAGTGTGSLSTITTPLNLAGGSTLTILPGGNTQNATTNYIGVGNVNLLGNATLQVVSNQSTTGLVNTGGVFVPTTRFGVDTTFREQSGVFDDNGYSTTFYGGLNNISAFFSAATTINTINGATNSTPNYGPASQTAFELNASGLTPPGGPNGSTQISTGYWTISDPAGTQGASVSPGGPNVQTMTYGNILINPYGQLSVFKANVNSSYYGAPGQVIDVNGLGCTTTSGALVSGASGSFTLVSTIALGTETFQTASIVGTAATTTTTTEDAIDATSGSTFMLTGNLVGAGLLLKQGAGILMILGSNNSATGATQIGNGTLTVGNASSNQSAVLGTGNLTLAQTSTSSSAVAFQNTAQTIGNLKSSFSDTTSSSAKETQTITLAGNNTVGTVLTVNETSPTTFGNNGFYAAQNSTIGGVGSVVLSAGSTSTLTLNSANTYTGGTSINGGTLRLNFAAVAANPTANPPTTGLFPATSNILAPTGALTMGGGTLLVNGATSGTSTQTVASLSVNPGASAIIDTSNGVASTLTITSGTLNRSVGGTLNFTSPTTGSIGFAGPTTPTLAGGILGGWATVNGTDWATIAGGDIVALPALSYTNDTWAGGANTTVTTNDAPAAGSTTNSLQFNSGAGAVTVTLSGTNVITTGGILVTPAAALGSTISGGTLEGAAGADLVVIQNSATPLTISSVVADNGAATGLTLSGGGTLALTGGNTYSGTTFINSGTLRIGGGGSSGSLGAGAVVDNATLSFDRNHTALVVNNVISGTGAINQIGTGTTTLAAANTLNGPTSISAGTLQLANANALQNSTVTIGVDNGLTFSPNFSTFTIGGLAGSANEQLQAAGGGGEFALAGSSASADVQPGLTLQVGNNASSTANSAYTGVLSGSGGLTKIGAGTQTLSGANVYGGPTAVNGGTLELDFTAATAPSSNILPSGSALNVGGGTLVVNGAASGGGSSQSVASLTVNPGASAIVNVSNNSVASALTITSPSIARNVGGTIDFTLPAGAQSATNGIVSTATNTNGILGGWATVGGTDWATVSGGNLVALPALSYTSDTWAAGANTTVTQNDTPASGSTTNSLQFASTTAGNQITLSGTNVITSGGILVSSAFTAAGTISGGTIKGASGGDLVVIQNSVSDFSISSVIADNGGPTGLSKSGPGTLVLGGTSANNTFTGGVYINQGTILLNAGNFWTSGGIVNPPSGQVFSASNTVNFGSNAPSLNPANWNTVGSIPTLNLNGLNLTIAGLNSAGAAMVQGTSSGFFGGQVTLTIAGNGTYDYAGTLADGGSALFLTLSGNGTQILSGTDTYSGPTTINSGTLQIGDGGTGGALGTATVTNNGSLAFDLSSDSTVANTIQGMGSLSQIGAGTTTLTAANSYAGGTIVTGGTLATTLNGTLGTGPVNVSGGAVDLSDHAISIGALTVGSGGTLNVAIGKLVTSTGAASFGGTLNISGTPSGNLDELIAYSGAPTGYFATTTSVPNYALLYATGQLDLLSYSGLSAESGTTTTINGTVQLMPGQLPLNGGGSTVINGSLLLAGAQVQVSNGSSVTINGQPILNSGTVTVGTGSTVTLNNNTSTPAAGTGPVTVSIAAGGTLQLAGTSSALASGVNVTNNGSTASNGGLSVTGANQVAGVVSGTISTNGDGATTYSGDTVVGPGASLTATQILQNSITISAGSTVTIAPSSSAGGAVQLAANSTNAVASAASADGSNSGSGNSGSDDPLAAIQAEIAAGSISSAKGQQLENRLAAIERLATSDPGLDVSLLESRILSALLPASSLLPPTDSSPINGSGSGLLAADGSAFGSASASALGGATATFASSESFAGSPAAVPEPSTLLLAGLGLLGLASISFKRRRANVHRRGA